MKLIIILANDVDLSNATTANLSFYARWDIEAGYDYVQVEVSTNNEGHGFHSVVTTLKQVTTIRSKQSCI